MKCSVFTTSQNIFTVVIYARKIFTASRAAGLSFHLHLFILWPPSVFFCCPCDKTFFAVAADSGAAENYYLAWSDIYELGSGPLLIGPFRQNPAKIEHFKLV